MEESRKQRIHTFSDDRTISICIYSITNTANGKIYIGQTTRKAGKRWGAHLSVKSGAGKSAIKCAITKYGKDSFAFAVLDTAENQIDLDLKEIAWISKLNSVAPSGYNLTYGGSSKKICSEETRSKMRASARARFEREGRTVIPETEEEHAIRRAAWALASKERLTGNTYRRGKKTSQEAVEKMRIAKTGVPVPKRYKPIIGSDGSSYPSIKHAVVEIGCNHATLMKHLSGKLQTVYGIVYSYASRGGI
jgi:group I intron endonuclease